MQLYAGCVFLPALGYFTYQSNVGRYYDVDEGWYWTSDTDGDHQSYYMHFPAVTNTYSLASDGWGMLVRLVYKY